MRLMSGWLGLPAVTGLTLIFAVLRKELALQLLVTLAVVQFGWQVAFAGDIILASTPSRNDGSRKSSTVATSLWRALIPSM